MNIKINKAPFGHPADKQQEFLTIKLNDNE